VFGPVHFHLLIGDGVGVFVFVIVGVFVGVLVGIGVGVVQLNPGGTHI